MLVSQIIEAAVPFLDGTPSYKTGDVRRSSSEYSNWQNKWGPTNSSRLQSKEVQIYINKKSGSAFTIDINKVVTTL